MKKNILICAIYSLALGLPAFGGDLWDNSDYSGVTHKQAVSILTDIEEFIPSNSRILSIDLQNPNKIRIKTATSTEPLGGRGSVSFPVIRTV